jgi:hypothetical protein
VRLLSGRTRDPLVGRDILVGCVLGITGGWLGFGVSQFAPESLKRFAISRPDLPNNVAELWALRGPREAVAAVLSVQVNIATHVLFLLMALLLFRFLSRRTWIAASLHWSLYVLLFSSFGLAGVAVWITLWLAVLFRFGLLAALVGTFTTALLAEFPLTTNAGAWQAYATWAPFSVCAALTLFGFTVSLGQQSAFRDPMAEP